MKKKRKIILKILMEVYLILYSPLQPHSNLHLNYIYSSFIFYPNVLHFYMVQDIAPLYWRCLLIFNNLSISQYVSDDSRHFIFYFTKIMYKSLI